MGKQQCQASKGIVEPGRFVQLFIFGITVYLNPVATTNSPGMAYPFPC